MVLSTTKRTAAIDSIVNRPQGGGPKKAGFPYLVGRETWTTIHFRERGTAQFLDSFKHPAGGLRYNSPASLKMKFSRPVYIRPGEYRP
jgi:hypothetical protein